MTDLIRIAKDYISQGMGVIPVDSLKQPIIKTWGKYQIEPMSTEDAEKYFKNAWGIGMLMGGKHGLHAIDLDTKYFLVNDLLDRIKGAVPRDILAKMSVRETMSGGQHWVFSCKERTEGNQKLAQRHTTPEEKHEVYIKAFQNYKTRENALKIASNEKVKVLIETRSSGGYVLIPPTPGYKQIYGEGFQELTGQEYDLLLETLRSFNEYTEIKKNRDIQRYSNFDINPFKIADQRLDVLQLMEKSGWEISERRHKTVRLKRPGAISASSAIYDVESRILSVFTTSSVFDVGSYAPASVYTILECDNDTSLAYHKLIEEGYGEEI